MRSAVHFALVGMAFLSVVSGSKPAIADDWPNRPKVLHAAQVLSLEIKELDRALHSVGAPHHVLDTLHHLEQTTLVFVQRVQGNCSYADGSLLFHHIHSDFHSFEYELNYHHYLLHYQNVALEWKHANTAYRALDYEMYHLDKERWSDDKVDGLKRDLQDLTGVHE